jgi:hypothetical protein
VTPNLPGEEGLNYPVRLRITAHQLIVEDRNKDEEDWTSIPVNAEVQGRSITVSINRRYLLNALRFGLNELEVEDPLSPVVFSKGGKKMVIMPLQPDDSPVKTTKPTDSKSVPTTATTPTAEQTAPPKPAATTEERTTMNRTARATTPEPMTTFQPVETHTNNGSGNGNGNGSTVKSLVDHVEQIKESLKTVLRDLTTVIDAVKVAEKEKRTTDKEIDAIRSKLRQIQNVTI